MDALEDTQPMETQVWDDCGYQRYSKLSGDQQPHTFGEGDTGHVEFDLDRTEQPHHTEAAQDEAQNAQQPPGEGDEDVPADTDDELATVTQVLPEDITSPAMPTPVTPALGLRKNIHTEPSSEIQPVAQDYSNLFKDQSKTPTMGLTQLFAQTQGTSSPAVANVTPGAIFERPSPRFAGYSSGGRRTASSPIRSDRADGAPNNPQDLYVSTKESQELRRLRMQKQNGANIEGNQAVNNSTDTDMVDLTWSISAKKRKRAIDREKVRSELKGISVPMKSSPVKRRRLQARSHTMSSVTPAAKAKSFAYVNLLSEDTPRLHKRSQSAGENDYASEYSEHSEDGEDEGDGMHNQHVLHTAHTSRHIPTPLKRPADCVHNMRGSLETGRTSVEDALWSSQKNAQRHISQSQEQVMASQHERASQSARHRPRNTQSDRIADSQPDHAPPETAEESAPPYPFMPSSPESRRTAIVTQALSSCDRDRRAGAIPQVAATSSLPAGPPETSPNRRQSPSASSSRLGQNRNSVEAIKPMQIIDESPELASSPPFSNAAARQQVAGLKRAKPTRSRSPLSQEKEVSKGLEDSAQARSLPAFHSNVSHPDGMQGFSTAQTHFSVTPRKRATARSVTDSDMISQSPNLKKIGDFSQISQVSLNSINAQDVMGEDDIELDRLIAKSPQRASSNSPARIPRRQSSKTHPTSPRPRQSRSKISPGCQPQATQESQDPYELKSPVPKTVAPRKIPRRLKGAVKGKDVRETIENGNATDRAIEERTRDLSREEPALHPHITHEQATSNSSQLSPLPESTPPTSPGQGQNGSHHESEVNEPRNPGRIFARFSGAKGSQWYPATLIGPLSDNSDVVKVHFDDGNVTTMNYWQACAFDVRINDVIKVNLGHMRKFNWVVRELKAGSSGADESGPALCDIHGHQIAVVSKKHSSDTHTTSPELEEVLLRDVYLTSEQWKKFKDRRFEKPSDVLEIAPRYQTPLQSATDVSAPSSRNRRQPASAIQNAAVSAIGTPSDQGIFTNMVFVLTFAAQNEAIKVRTKSAIQSHGGAVVDDAFDKLFEKPQEREDIASPANLRMKPAYKDTGFTALIADAYSRKAKFIQALALNIPCLHHKWIARCIESGEPVSWQQYLLPAGESDMLDNAVRSRVMVLPDQQVLFPPLADLVKNRLRLVKGHNILIVTKNLGAERKSVYFFLAHAMGGQKIKRVSDLPAAKSALAEDGDWDWVAVDKDVVRDAKRQLQPSRGKSGGVKKVKVVGDTFIIQTLIFGALAES